MTRSQRPSIYFNVHLVSDSTGETLNAIQRAACAQFENVQALEHNYYLVRSERQLERVMREIEAAPGVVWYTISDEILRGRLESFCREKVRSDAAGAGRFHRHAQPPSWHFSQSESRRTARP
jgi:regulator of PEP synthase PpsR (kinase-PPPase family)